VDVQGGRQEDHHHRMESQAAGGDRAECPGDPVAGVGPRSRSGPARDAPGGPVEAEVAQGASSLSRASADSSAVPGDSPGFTGAAAEKYRLLAPHVGSHPEDLQAHQARRLAKDPAVAVEHVEHACREGQAHQCPGAAIWQLATDPPLEEIAARREAEERRARAARERRARETAEREEAKRQRDEQERARRHARMVLSAASGEQVHKAIRSLRSTVSGVEQTQLAKRSDEYLIEHPRWSRRIAEIVERAEAVVCV